jgi:hypothetical protein
VLGHGRRALLISAEQVVSLLLLLVGVGVRRVGPEGAEEAPRGEGELGAAVRVSAEGTAMILKFILAVCR